MLCRRRAGARRTGIATAARLNAGAGQSHHGSHLHSTTSIALAGKRPWPYRESVGCKRFRTCSRCGRTDRTVFVAPNGKGGWYSLFGGQLVAQALEAASRTVGDDRLAHSLHAYFLRPGAFDVPIDLAVERERDGGSFSSRRVLVSQGGKPILSLIASYHTDETGPRARCRDDA